MVLVRQPPQAVETANTTTKPPLTESASFSKVFAAIMQLRLSKFKMYMVEVAKFAVGLKIRCICRARTGGTNHNWYGRSLL